MTLNNRQEARCDGNEDDFSGLSAVILNGTFDSAVSVGIISRVAAPQWGQVRVDVRFTASSVLTSILRPPSSRRELQTHPYNLPRCRGT
jgi:hypothetical protein